MKFRVFIAALLIIAAFATAAPVSVDNARNVALNFFSERTYQVDGLQAKNADKLQSNSFYLDRDENGDAYYYIFNIGDNGFVIVSGDDVAYPVLGYSYESSYDPEIAAPAFESIVAGYRKNIDIMRGLALDSDPDVNAQWQRYSQSTSFFEVDNTLTLDAVSPLLGSIAFNQSGGWNDSIPVDTCSGDQPLVGCVAVAVGQIMKYWNYPTNPADTTVEAPGALSLYLGDKTYNWAAVEEGTATAEAAKILYHVGLAVSMQYGCDASGAYDVSADSALRLVFNFTRDSVHSVVEASELKTEIDAGRVVYFSGEDSTLVTSSGFRGSGGGHAFNCDGYEGSGTGAAGNYFHFNLGWGGYANGYYALTALTPATGYDYSAGHGAIMGIQPKLDFAWSPRTAMTPCRIQFIDLSPVETSNWTWDLDSTDGGALLDTTMVDSVTADGSIVFVSDTTSSRHNPIFLFRAAGTYTVNFIASIEGTADTLSKDIIIQAAPTGYVIEMANDGTQTITSTITIDNGN